MSRLLARFSLSLLVIIVLAIALPRLYDLAFEVDVARTQMFYSPVRKAFVFREHHGNHDFIYADQHGETFDRKTFETLIPFIYYKNMDIWGLLPLTIDGQTFDMETIRDTRQVFELKPREIRDNHPEIAIYPLIESNPGRARLRFPEDVFRMTAERMEFVNVDTNTVDEELTALFTEALTAEGFRFPARLVAGKQTILKPFDEGYFVIDDGGTVFHVKRVDGQPSVVKTPIPSDLGVRHIKVSENKRRLFYGLLLTEDGRLFLISYDDYRLVPLPTEGYAPDRMDYKLLLNPVFPTAVFGNDETINAVAMNPDLTPIDRYTRPVPGTKDMLGERIARGLFPFVITFDDRASAYLSWSFTHHGWTGLIGTTFSLLFLLVLAGARRSGIRQAWPDFVLVAIGGLFGLVATFMLPAKRDVGRAETRPLSTLKAARV